MNPKNLFSAALISSSLFLAGAASAATVLTFTPTNTNPGCTDVNAGTCGAVGTSPQYKTDNATVQYSGKLDIAAPTGASTFAEAGNLRIVSFQLGGITQNSGVDRQSGGNYDVYATYTSTGTGTWVGTTFLTTSVNSLNVTLYASPSSGTAAVLGDVQSGTTLGASAVTMGSQDFVLGTATLIPSSTNFGFAAISGGSGGPATTTLVALLDFNPAPGTTGANGFFTAPTPFDISIGAQAGGNANNTTWSVNGGGVRISTFISNPGGGSLAFTSNAIPEPAALSLVGLGLVGLGMVKRRKAKTAA